MRVARHLCVSLVSVGAACTSILDFDGYQYAGTGAASGTGDSSVTSTSASTGTSDGGETSDGSSTSTSTNASAGGSGPGSGGMGGSGGLKPNGDPCNEDYECLSGDCKDDVCCDSECEGICEACDLAGDEGTCSNVPAGQDPHDDCTQPATCNGMGMCQ